MKLPKNIPILSFLGRYWLLCVLFAIFLAVTLNDALFRHVGTFVYLPALATGVVVVALFLRHIFFAESLDEDVRTGKFNLWWDNELSPAEKTRWILGFTLGTFLWVAIIAAALIR